MIRRGILLLPYRFGWGPFARLLEVKSYHEREHRQCVREAGGVGGVASLERMVVRPGAQGGGIGSHCLGAALTEGEEAGYGVILSTQVPCSLLRLCSASLGSPSSSSSLLLSSVELSDAKVYEP